MNGRLDVVVHGHFYQPPREDPATGTIPLEPSAAPFHDWNQRIHEECYGPVTSARLLDGEGRMRGLSNTLEWISFDAAPTLLSWLEAEAPGTYAAVLDADARSRERLGHGNAIAAPWHHVILPLASPGDRRTEIRWGLADFRRRFGREPQGFWLPEAAVDTATLADLADEGIRFVVLGPSQVREAPPRGLPGRLTLPGGRELAVFVYDGGLAHGVSFGGLVRDAGAWARALLGYRRPDADVVVSLATDGETFGHHHRFGEMGLAVLLERMRETGGAEVVNFSSVLARHGTVADVELVEPSSWSCPHGVDRWQKECGCRIQPGRPWNQAWRAPLREALESLARSLHDHYRAEAAALFSDPAGARDRYGRVLGAGPDERRAFIAEEASTTLDEGQARRALELLEMERATLRTFTSCAWFFDDLGRVEILHALRAAAHALRLAGDRGPLESELRKALARAWSNDPEIGDGAAIWDRAVRPTPPAGARVAAVAALATAAGHPVPGGVGVWSLEAGEDGWVRVRDGRTGAATRWRVETFEGPDGDLRARVERGDGTANEVAPDDLPHPWDTRVDDGLRARRLYEVLDPAERAAVLGGRWTHDTARARVLLRLLPELGSEPSGEELARVRRLVTELAGGGGVPPSVQAALWRAASAVADGSRRLRSSLEAAGIDAGAPGRHPS